MVSVLKVAFPEDLQRKVSFSFDSAELVYVL